MGRLQYLGKRLLLSVPVFFVGTSLTFLIIRVGPIDPAAAILGVADPQATDAYMRIRRRLGLTRPLWEQYASFMLDVVTLDLGQSWVVHQNRSTVALLVQYAPRTLWLGFWSVLVALVLGVPLGFFAGLNPNSWRDYVASFGGIIWRAMPNFWLAIIVSTLLANSAVWLGFDWTSFLVKTQVVGPPGIADVSGLRDLLAATKKILPAALVLGSASLGNELRIGRTAVIETAREQYVEAAKMRGVPGRRVVWKHVFRNALIPLVPVISSEAYLLVGGAVLVEQIFGINGIGSLFLQAITRGDIPLATSLMIVFIALLVVVNIVQDLAYTVIDPRVGYEGVER